MAATVLFVLAATSASAATITARGGSGDLNRKQSWIGNKVPGPADIALWSSSSAAMTASLGGNLSWLGIQIINPAGALTINAGNTLTLGSSGIDMSAATVNFTLNCAVALAASQTWSVNSGRILTAAGVVSGSFGLTKSGAGTLVLSGTNSYTGGTNINGGTLSVSSAANLGGGTSALTINPTGTLQTTSTFTSARAVTLGGTGGAASGGTFEVAAATTHTRTGVISGSGSLTKTGTGTLSLSAANTYTGDTYLNAGTLSISNNQALGAQPALGSTANTVHMASGTTLLSSVSSTANNRRLDLVSGTATLDVASGFSQQQNGLVYGAGGLIKAGGGTEILTNANTYSGGTTVNAGTLQVNNTSGSGTGTGSVVVNNGGTLSGLPTAVGFSNAGTISGAVTINSGGTLLARSGSTFTFGGLTLNASALISLQLGASTAVPLINITGTNAFSLAGLATINVSNIGALAAGTYRLFDYTGSAFSSITNLQLGSTPGGGFTYSLSNNQSNTSIDLLVSTTNLQWGNDANGNWSAGSNWTNGAAPNAVGAQANFLGVINSARTVTVDGAFTAGTITFNNANAYTLGASGIAGQGITLSNNGTAAIDVLAGSHIISAPLTLAHDTDVDAISNTSLTLSGAIGEGGSRALTLNGAGSVTLSGAAANTYSGLTSVQAGTLVLNKTAGVNAISTGGLSVAAGASATSQASHQIADTASLSVNGTWNLGASSETIGALTGGGSLVTAAGGVLTVGASNNLSSEFAGVISGGGTLTKTGTGTLTLTGANTFGGAGQSVSINAGALEIATDASLGNTANSVTFNGGTLLLAANLTSNRAMLLNGAGTIDSATNAVTLGGQISGAGGLTKAGAGTLTLTGTNTYSGGTTINGGSVIVDSASSLGASSGALTINNGTLEIATGFTGSRNVALGSSASTIQVNSGQTYSLGGAVTGTGTLNKTGAGTLILAAANNYSGETEVSGGTLTAAAASGSALANTSAITVNSGGTLLLGGNNQINNNAGVTLDGGTFAKGKFSEGAANAAGMGALTLTAPDSRLDFGANSVGVLSFASFNPGDDLNVLTIDNWTGIANTIGSATTDRLIFNSSQSANLAYFSFTGYDGATQFSLGGGFYEVVPVTPVPEPATYAAGLLTVAVLVVCERRRRRSRRALEPG